MNEMAIASAMSLLRTIENSIADSDDVDCVCREYLKLANGKQITSKWLEKTGFAFDGQDWVLGSVHLRQIDDKWHVSMGDSWCEIIQTRGAAMSLLRAFGEPA